MDKGYKIIRVITVAPVLALIMTGLIAGSCEGVFPSPWYLVCSIFFLGILPLLAYPLQKYIPAYKDKGREGQRNLAIIFAAAGFTMGCIVSFVFPASDGLRVIFLEYFCGAFAVLIFNKSPFRRLWLAAQIVMKVFQLSTLCCKIVCEKLHYKAWEEL